MNNERAPEAEVARPAPRVRAGMYDPTPPAGFSSWREYHRQTLYGETGVQRPAQQQAEDGVNVLPSYRSPMQRILDEMVVTE